MPTRLSLVSLVFACIVFIMPAPLHASFHNGQLRAPVRLSASGGGSGVQLALKDLSMDFERTLGPASIVSGTQASDIDVKVDSSLSVPESWTIRITGSKVLIEGADDLGAIYGIYEFSKRFLGVDPLWYWEDQQLPRRETLKLSTQTLHSTKAAFRYRGWFLNDEDLLCEWKPASGRRQIDYPFYDHVMSLDIADRAFEALLRSGGNLIIPGSFINVMNPPEAELVKRAVERGLYITQHHIEPLGVSYVGFQKYWKEHGEDAKFSYGSNPDKVRETWKVYAAKWHELAGNHVIWQLGLRGNGDRPVWTSDASVKESDAGAFISHAIADQWKIIRAIDLRPNPPATLTLWDEGSRLMQQGSLAIPAGTMLVFADEGSSQQLQGDFESTPRSPNHKYGVYYHLAFWGTGPHLIQGTVPSRMKATFDSVFAKGDTEYAILNVSNIRPFTLGIAAAMEIMQEGPAWREQEFYASIPSPALQKQYRDFLGSFVTLPDGRLLQDGTCWAMIKDQLSKLEAKQHGEVLDSRFHRITENPEFLKRLHDSIIQLKAVVSQYPREDSIPFEYRNLYSYNLRNQASMLIDYYACLQDLLQQTDNKIRLKAAEDDINDLLKIREMGATGRWEDWYRGDRKEDVPGLLQRIQQDERLTSNEQ